MTGWTGTNCDTDVNECLDANICGDEDKTCVNSVGGYTCVCRSGLTKAANGTCIGMNLSFRLINYL